MPFIFSFLILFLYSFAFEKPDEPIVVEGYTMGTTYRIIYFDGAQGRDFKSSIDSLLSVVNKGINTYDPTSEISVFNSGSDGVTFQLPYFRDLLKKSRKIYRKSDGAFDPTVMPLINAWGFGPLKSSPPDGTTVDSLRALVGFDKVKLRKKCVTKPDPRIQLDMGGIGQGFGADVIFGFLKSKGIRHMLVELGGEGVSCGINIAENRPWRIGILDPNSTPDNQFFKAYVTLRDKAFTTSGNYFNYRVIDGKKFGHTLDPATGYPVHHSLLSVSVFADDCTTADGWATAFMVMGLEQTITQLKSMRDIDALLIYSTEKGELRTYITPGMKTFVTLEP